MKHISRECQCGEHQDCPGFVKVSGTEHNCSCPCHDDGDAHEWKEKNKPTPGPRVGGAENTIPVAVEG